jgi:hypothetical protein
MAELPRVASVLTFATFAVTLGFATTVRADCSTSEDCAADRSCKAGRCVKPVEAIDTGESVPADPGRTGRLITFAGLGIFGTGYLAAVAAAGIGTSVKSSDESKYGGSCDSSAPLSFIPVAGPLMTSSQYPQHQVATYGQGSPHVLDCNGGRTPVVVMSVIGEVLQIGGLATALTGLVILAATSSRTPATTVSLAPGAPGASLGLTLSVDAM